MVHARALLTSVTGGPVDYIEADVRDPETILQDAAEILDLSQPTAVMMLSILGEIPDSDHPGPIVARLLEPLPVGSYLAISDCIDTNPALNQAIATYNQDTVSPYKLRSPQQFAAFFDGLAMIPPGIVAPAQWPACPDRYHRRASGSRRALRHRPQRLILRIDGPDYPPGAAVPGLGESADARLADG